MWMLMNIFLQDLGWKLHLCISVQNYVYDDLVVMYETASLAGDQRNKTNPKSKRQSCVWIVLLNARHSTVTYFRVYWVGGTKSLGGKVIVVGLISFKPGMEWECALRDPDFYSLIKMLVELLVLQQINLEDNCVHRK